MIDRFHVLYVGQIELDNIGRNGTPANDRRYSDERLREVFATAKDVAQTMDDLGFDALWMAEHHFQREGYEVIPNLIQTGLWLATQTKRLKFGCAFNVLPMWHPIRMAEDFAMADIVTDGRVIMGVGRGYHTREVETFGAPLIDQNANREHFEEGVDIVFKAFNEESFSHKGKNFTIGDDCQFGKNIISQQPVGVLLPSVPQSFGEAALKRPDYRYGFRLHHPFRRGELPRSHDEQPPLPGMGRCACGDPACSALRRIATEGANAKCTRPGLV